MNRIAFMAFMAVSSVLLATNATAESLPANPWATETTQPVTSAQQKRTNYDDAATADYRDNASLSQEQYRQAKGLPANPWAAKTNESTIRGQQMHINYDDTAVAYYQDNVPLPQGQRRLVGGVGRISAPVRRKVRSNSSSDDSDVLTSLGNIFSSSEDTEVAKTETTKSANDSDTVGIDMQLENEYEKLKHQGVKKFNQATAPIRGYYDKWKKALDDVSEMNLKDFMQ